MKVRFLSPASHELDDAMRYYDHEMTGLGFRFFQEVEKAIVRIQLYPEGWTKVGAKTRRCLLKGFPYALLYTVEGDEILVQAVAHLHRDPQHYRDRVQ